MLPFVSLTHDYYIVNLPPPQANISQQSHNTLFGLLQYQKLQNFKGDHIKFAPVIRLYGYHEGISTCIHVHGYFPYFYIKIQELHKQFSQPDFIIDFIDTIHNAYRMVFLSALSREQQQKFELIFRAEITHKYDFYGVHFKQELFLKIYLYDSQYITQLVQLLSSGCIMNYQFQAYESHLSYFMHFYSDMGIFGMQEMQVCDYAFRRRLDRQLENLFKNSQEYQQILDHVQNDKFSNLYKLSSCLLEFDCHYRHIITSDNICLQNTQSQRSNSLIENFSVELTLTLNKLWADERINRQQHQIPDPLILELDKSKNSENENHTTYPSMNLLDQVSYQEIFKEHQRVYLTQVPEKVYPDKCEFNMAQCQNFFNGQQSEKDHCKKSIIERFKEYVRRKKDLLDSIGEDDNEEAFDFDQIKDEISKELSQEQQEEDLNDLDEILKSQAEIVEEIQPPQNPELNRKQQKSIFLVCEFCHKIKLLCICSKRDSQIEVENQYFGQEYQSFVYKFPPPTIDAVIQSIKSSQTMQINQKPYFSNKEDLYRFYNININQLADHYTLEQQFDRHFIKELGNKKTNSIKNENKFPYSYDYNFKNYNIVNDQIQDIKTYLYLPDPPSIEVVLDSIKLSEIKEEFTTYNKQSINEKLSLMVFEVFAQSQIKLPDPYKDEIDFLIFQCLSLQDQSIIHKIIIKKDAKQYDKAMKGTADPLGIDSEYDHIIVKCEMDMLKLFSLLVIILDPDFITGYDLEAKCLYYLVNRADQYGYDILQECSRSQSSYDKIIELFLFSDFVLASKTQSAFSRLLDQLQYTVQTCDILIKKRPSFTYVKQHQRNQTQLKAQQMALMRKKTRFNLYIVGRVLINTWRNIATDYKFVDYTLESVVYELFKIKLPILSIQELSKLYNANTQWDLFYVFNYFDIRLRYTIQLLNQMSLIPRTIEIAKLYGCEYEAVGYRGSQFKIESILNRVTKQNQYVLLSATRVQVATQKILECVPLVLEPPKSLTVDPVIVLDFQSLYPSIMIAYNLCYSTCLGSIVEPVINGVKRFGVRSVKINEEFAIEDVFVTPNKVAFLKKNVRLGILPQILLEFLMTRIMIKKSTKYYDKQIGMQYSFKQMALKMFMNVMYGYCGASFSGRMPSGDIADSVVEIGKTILKNCIDHINNHPKWQAKVLYGDTDSLFVVLKGRSMNEAGQIGEDIAKAITELYPHPIELKFEKTYSSLVLLAKKRYVGLLNGQLDAKGIETIRRDGCKATSRIMDEALQILFKTKDLSRLKQYMNQQWVSILNGYCNISEFIIAKEVKLGTYANPQRLPAHAVVAVRLMEKDPMKRPKGGERLKYFVVQSTNKNASIKDLVLSVEEFLESGKYSINIMYYITRQINSALGRIFQCFDIDIKKWFAQLQKGDSKQDFLLQSSIVELQSKSKARQYTLQHYFKRITCLVCDQDSKAEICQLCLEQYRALLHILQLKQNILLQQQVNLDQCCMSCQQSNIIKPCLQLSCKILYKQQRSKAILTQFKSKARKYLEFYEDFI